MKLLRLLLMPVLLWFSATAFGQVSIGTGTTTGQSIPIEFYYGYSYSQSIYNAAEINASGSITSIEWSYATGSTSHSNDIVIYMGHTTKSSFSSTTDWEAIGNLTQVYSGNMAFAPGTISITLDASFAYNGTDNLIIAVEENTSGYHSNSDEFYCTSVSGNRSIYYRNDNTNPDPNSPPTATGLKNYIPNVTLVGITQSCPMPSTLTTSGITATSADFGWTENGTATSWQIEYGLDGFTPGTNVGTATTVVTGSNPFSATGLMNNTTYDFYVRAICAPGDTSAWSGEGTVTTPCAAVADFSIDFDASSSLPACTQKSGSTGSVYTSTSYSNSGSRGLYMYSPGATYVLPTTSNTGDATHWLKLYARTSSGTTSLKVGYMTDPDDAGTFTELQSISVTNSFTEFMIQPGATPSNGDYLAIQHTGYTSTYLDDIVWEVIPSCIVPTDLGASSITATSASLNWTANSSETDWEIVVQADGTGMPASAYGTGTATTSNPYSATGLTANTNYEYYVRADCNGDGSDLSDWTGPYTFTTLCAVETPDYTEDFTTFLNPCWEQATGPISGPTAFGTSGWTADGFGNNGSTGSARFNIYNTGGDEWLITPTFDLTGGGFEINLDAACTDFASASGGGISADDAVYVMQSTDDGTTWTTIYTWDNANVPSNTGDNVTIDISGVTSATTKFAIFALEGPTSGNDYDFFIDNFKVRTPPSCFAPTALGASSIMATSASLNWTANSSETAWEIVVQAQGTGTPVGSGTAISTNPYSATGLAGNTAYEYYVRADCDANGFSTWAGPYDFTTPCVAVTDFSQNFDAALATPDCWKAYDPSSGSSNASSSQAYSGSNSWYLYNSWSTSYEAGLIGPEMSTLGSAYRLKFWAYSPDASVSIKVGTADASDVFTELTTVNLTAQNTWEEFVVDFSAYAGSDTRIMLLHGQGGTYKDIYIDDISWEEILANDAAVTVVTPPNSGCGLTASESVDVTIFNNGTATIGVGAASVALTGASNSPAAVMNTGTIAAGATEVVTITGVDLSAIQAYTLTATVTLAGDGNAANDAATGQTANVTVISSFPYTDDFESGMGAWTSGGTNNSWAFGTPADTDINSAASGSNAWMTGLTTNYNDYENSYVLSPCFDFSSLTAPKVSLSVYTEAENSYDGALLQYSIDNGATWVTIGDMNSGTNWYNDGTISGLNWADANQDGWTGTSAWATAEHSIAALGGESSVRFRIAFGSDGSTNDDGFAFDDFHIENVVCPDVTDLGVASLMPTSANLEWTENGTATTWDIEWGTQGFTATGTPTITGTSDNPYNLTGLTANTSYDFYVRSGCGSNWVGPYTFTTLCNAVADFDENFDGVSTGTLPDCWTELVVSSSTSADVETSTSYDQSAPNSVRFDPNNDASATLILVSPQVNTLGSAYRLNFNVVVSSTNMTYSVGTITNPTDPATFTALYTNETLASSATPYAKSYDFSAYAGSDNFIAIKANQSTTYQYLYVDDMVWEALPVTPPTCGTINSPADAATDISQNPTFSWDADIDATGYKLQIGTTDGGSEFLASTDVGNVTSYAVTGLAYSTTYYVLLTAYNANGDATGCTTTSFTTMADPTVTPPYNESFEGTFLPTGWAMDKTSGNDWTENTSSSNASEGSKSARYVYNSSEAADSWLFTTPVALEAGKTYIWSFDQKVASATYPENLKFTVGTMQTMAGQTTTLYDGNGLTNTTFEERTGSFTAPTTGSYYFAFHAYSGANQYTIYVDNLNIEEACPAITVTSVVGHNAGTVSADMECTDSEGWTHYWNSSSNQMILSIKKNGNNIGTIGDGTFTVSATDNGSATFYADGVGFITNGVGGVLMDRKWDVNATTQPASNVDVRFYYTAQNYTDVNTEISNQGGTPLTGHTQLNFYKVTSGEDPFGIANLSSSDVRIIQNGGSSGINTWVAGTFGSDFYGEYQVAGFSGGGGGGASGGVALPVEMTSFTAKVDGNNNVLNWSTASEENNSHFEIERSTNGVDFETIGQVQGNGTTVEESNYNFVDETPATVSYYRLRQVDFDGNYTYSEIAMVKRNVISNTVTLFPVPVQDRLTVNYTSTANEDMMITLTDVTGRIVLTKTVNTIQGENQFRLDLSKLPAGSYFIKLQSNSDNFIHTIIKK